MCGSLGVIFREELAFEKCKVTVLMSSYIFCKITETPVALAYLPSES